MTRSRDRRKGKTRYVSCTDAQWAEVKRRADAAGMRRSPYLIGRALDADLSIFGDRPEPAQLVLSPEDQELMARQVEFMAELLGRIPGEASLERLGNQIEFLRDAKVTEMIGEGRIDELFLAFGKLFGRERAERLLAKAVKERRGALSVEVTVRGPARRA